MFEWLKKNRSSPSLPSPLTGAPAVRRQKTYSAQSGYVYQYFYNGLRRVGESTEYVFEVSADRKAGLPVSVFLPDASVAHWARNHCRELAAQERYGVVKMALFQAFDERPDPASMNAPVEIQPGEMESLAGALDL